MEKINGGPLTFGQLINSLRKCDEWSQVKLAAKMGISKAYLCDIEKERRLVSPELAAHFAKVMGYSLNQFVALALEDQLMKAGLKLRVELLAA